MRSASSTRSSTIPVSGSSASRRQVTASRPGRHAATFTGGSPGAFQGSFSYLLQDEDGQTIESHSISAGLDYPGVGPEHAYLKDLGRAEYRPITDTEAMDAFASAVPHRGHHSGDRIGARGGGCAEARRRARSRRDDPGEPVGPRRQGRRDRGQVVRAVRRRTGGHVMTSRLAGLVRRRAEPRIGRRSSATSRPVSPTSRRRSRR